MDMMTPNTLKSLLSASVFISDEERDQNRYQKQRIKQEINEREKREKQQKMEDKKKNTCQLSAECNEFIPGATLSVKRQLSVINEDDEDEQDLFDIDNDNFNCFEAQES
mmetsp:Transcript_65800/g.59081  ORF Transcript_65800/g.59081 Transcript_65800/m.59081 type:complete len:109 (+) Transcript_65800:2-328(+)